MAKKSGPNPRSFPKIIINYSSTSPQGPKTRLHTHFYLHTSTTGCGVTAYGSFFMVYYLLIEIYPLVPFPPSEFLEFSMFRGLTSQITRGRPSGEEP